MAYTAYTIRWNWNKKMQLPHKEVNWLHCASEKKVMQSTWYLPLVAEICSANAYRVVLQNLQSRRPYARCWLVRWGVPAMWDRAADRPLISLFVRGSSSSTAPSGGFGPEHGRTGGSAGIQGAKKWRWMGMRSGRPSAVSRSEGTGKRSGDAGERQLRSVVQGRLEETNR
jgi:hypothetical protein